MCINLDPFLTLVQGLFNTVQFIIFVFASLSKNILKYEKLLVYLWKPV